MNEVNEASPASETSEVERVVMRILWGSYELKPAGLGFIRLWHHNENLDMSRDEQFAENSKNDPDFCTEKYIPPAITLVVS